VLEKYFDLLLSLLIRTGSLGASNMKLSKLDFGRATVVNLQKQSGLIAWKGRGRPQHAGVAISHKSREAFRCRGSASETECECFYCYICQRYTLV